MFLGLFSYSSYVQFANFIYYEVSFYMIFFVVMLFLIEWLGRESRYALENLSKVNVKLRYAFYYTLVILIFLYSGENQQFIYFQF